MICQAHKWRYQKNNNSQKCVTVHVTLVNSFIQPHLSAPNPPKVMLSTSAVLHLQPPVQLHRTFFWNFLCPKHNTSLFTVQLVLKDKIQTTRGNQINAFLGFYAVQNGSTLPTFQDNLLVPSSMVEQSFFLDPVAVPKCQQECTVRHCEKSHKTAELITSW